LLPPRETAEGAALGVGGRARPAGAGPGLGLRSDEWRAVRRGRPAPDQWLRPRNRKAAGFVPRPQGRRIYLLWQLDLLRRLRRGGQPGGPAQAVARAGADGAWGGLGVAAEPADSLQPRVG